MSERGARQEIGVDSVRTLAFNAFAAALGIVTGIVIAKALGPQGKGEYSEMSLLQGGLAAVTGGIGASTTYFLTNARRPLADLSLPLLAMLATLSGIAVGGLVLWGLHAGFSPVLVIFAAATPAVIVLSWQQGLLLGLNQVKSLNAQMLGLAAATLAAVVAALAMYHGIDAVLWAWAIAIYGAAAVVVVRAVRVSGAPSGWEFRAALRALLGFGARSSLNGALGFLNYRIDSLVLVAYMGASSFGVYSIAVAGGETLFRISRALATATTYRIGTDARSDAALLAAKAIRTSTLAVAAASAVLFVSAPWIIEALYGPRFSGAVPALRILLPGIVLFASGGIFSQFFAFQLGRPMFPVYVSLVMIVVQVGMCVWLVPLWGLQGAALASTATYAVAAIGQTVYFCRVTGLPPGSVWIARAEDLRSLRALARRAFPSSRASSAP